MSKKCNLFHLKGLVCLVPLIVGLVLGSASTLGMSQVAAAPGTSLEPARPSAPDSPAARPGVRRPGIYAFWDYLNLDPRQYPIVGSHQDFSWARLQPTEGSYAWSVVDKWIDDHVASGKYVGIAFDAYGGIDSPETYATPAWIFTKYPHLRVDCGGYVIPRYWHADFLAEYQKFIRAVGQRYNGDPRIEWVQVTAGLYGETQPAEDRFDTCLQNAGLTSGLWVDTVNQITGIFKEAFPNTTLFLQYAPVFLYQSERRSFTDYAAARGVGLKHNGLKPDGGSGMIINDPNYALYGAGQYDPMFKWGAQVPIAWESYDNLLTGVEGTLWGIYSGLNKHADYMVLSLDVITRTERFESLQFANQYLGRTITDTPSVWVALRETEGTWYPQYGNYDFWLYQNDDVPGGKTVPLWRVGSAPEGRYTRRTDQATNNPYMYFNIDNGYIYGGTNRATINVTYYDQGTDTWELQYDATGTNNYKSAGAITKTNTRTWKKVSFTIEDAEFADGQTGGGKYAGSDFRIWSRGDGDETIHFVQVIREPGRPVTVSFQEGIDSYRGTEDTYLNAWQPSRNYGAEARTAVRSKDVVNGLLRFDLSAIPGNAPVSGAALQLYLFARSNSNPMTLEIYGMKRSWHEMQATWEVARTSTAWGGPGASSIATDREATAAASVALTVNSGWVTLDATSLVRGWVANPLANYGMLLKGQSSGSVEYSFYSADAPDPRVRPRLVVTYTSGSSAQPTSTPTPAPTFTPTPPGQPTPTFTPTSSGQPTRTPTPTSTPTPASTPTPTSTSTPTPAGSGWELKFTVPKAPPSTKVWSIYFPSPTIGYAVGGPEWTATSGVAFMYKTTDGGRTWAEITSHGQTLNKAFFSAVHCKDVNICWVVGRYGTILRTLDGGASWQKSATLRDPSGATYGGFLYSTLWTGTGNTVLVGATLNYLFRSTDGLNFSPVSVSNNYVVRAIECPTPNTCYASAKGRLYTTTNNGASWDRKMWLDKIPEDTRENDRYAYDISFIDNNTGWIAAVLENAPADVSPSTILKMTDATASTFAFQQQAALPTTLERLQMVSATAGYAVGWQGSIYRTTDGQTWQAMPPPPTSANLVSLFAFAENDVWVGDDQGHIWHYGGGGSSVPTPTPTSTPTGAPTATPSATPGASPTPTQTPTATPTATTLPGEPTATPTPTASGGTSFEVELNAEADTFLSAYAPASSYGSNTTFRVRSQDVMHGLMRFNLSSIPAGVTIQQAELTLFQNFRSNGNSLTLEAYAMRRAWDEYKANWNQASSGVAWGQPGASDPVSDRASSPAATVELNQAQGYFTMDLRSLVQGWVSNPSSNLGLQLRGVSVGSVEFSFASRENTAPAYWPRLRVKYATAPSPTPTLTGTSTPTATPSATPRASPTPTQTPTATLTPTPTSEPGQPTATPTLTGTSTPTSALPSQPRRLDSNYTTNPPVVDGDLSEWGGDPELVLDVNTARYVSPRSSPSPTDASLTLRSRWDAGYLYFAIHVTDDAVIADSSDTWRDDGVELAFDGSDDDRGGGADDHQFTLVVDGRVTDFGVNQAPGLIAAVRGVAGGYNIEAAIPQGLINAGNFFSGKLMGFTVGLHDDDDAGDWDSYLIWEGTSTVDRYSEFGTLALVGVMGAATPTPEPMTVVLRQGANGYAGVRDTFINAWSVGTNYGTNTELSVRSADVMASLLFFDLSGVVPTGAWVVQATLELYQSARSNSNTMTLEAYGLKRVWNAGQATWEYARTDQRWGQSGANDTATDRDASPSATYLLDRSSGQVTLDVTAIVRRWTTDANYGLLLKGQSDGSVEYWLYSSEHWQLDRRPRLTIQYEP